MPVEENNELIEVGRNFWRLFGSAVSISPFTLLKVGPTLMLHPTSYLDKVGHGLAQVSFEYLQGWRQLL